MADKVKSVEQFSSVFSEAIAHEKSKRGLGNRFHSAVVTLLNENPDAEPKALVKLFLETLTEVENTLNGELTAEFGEDATAKDLSAWRQYKSDYKISLEKVDRRDILKCTGPYQVKMKLNEVREAMKEKAEGGNTDGNPADNGAADGGAGSKAGDTTGHRVPASVQALIDEATTALEQMSEEDAVRIARGFKDKAWANMRNAKKKLAGVTGSATKSNAA